MVDVVREPMVVLDDELRVMAANEAFYDTFLAPKSETEGELLYELSNGQWKIPALEKMLNEVQQNHSYFKGFQVAHEFPVIGRKVIILNARQIHIVDQSEDDGYPPIILLAMEDVTDMLVVAESLANHANRLETKLTDRSQKLEITIGKLERDLRDMRDRQDNEE